MERLTQDHVIPLSKGGQHIKENIVPACPSCNSKKGNRMLHTSGMQLIRPPKRPAGHPVLRAGWAGPRYAEWKTFLDVAYWNVELSEDLVPPASLES